MTLQGAGFIWTRTCNIVGDLYQNLSCRSGNVAGRIGYGSQMTVIVETYDKGVSRAVGSTNAGCRCSSVGVSRVNVYGCRPCVLFSRNAGKIYLKLVGFAEGIVYLKFRRPRRLQNLRPIGIFRQFGQSFIEVTGIMYRSSRLCIDFLPYRNNKVFGLT